MVSNIKKVSSVALSSIGYVGSIVNLDNKTKLLLHLNDNVTDSSISGKTVTNNNVTFSSSVKKFGTHSAVFNGTNGCLSLADSDDWNFGAGDFTIDFWVYFNTLNNVSYYIYHQPQDVQNYSRLYYDKLNNVFTLNFYSSGVFVWGSDYSFEASTGQWYHIAIVRNGSSGKFYINGTQVGTTKSLSTVEMPNLSGTFYIGCQNGSSNYLVANIDEFEIIKGRARWTANFTPPIAEYGSYIKKIVGIAN